MFKDFPLVQITNNHIHRIGMPPLDYSTIKYLPHGLRKPCFLSGLPYSSSTHAACKYTIPAFLNRIPWFLNCHKDRSYCEPVRITISLSTPDSAPHISPGLPKICRTAAFGLGSSKVVNVPDEGSKRTRAFVPKSLSQTIS